MISLPSPAYKVELDESVHGVHSYKINGVETFLPGFSTIYRKVIAKPALIPWAANLAAEATAAAAKEEVKKSLADGKWCRPLEDAATAWEKIGKSAPNAKRDKAADDGTAIHSSLEQFAKGYQATPIGTKNGDKAVENFLKFWASSGLKFVASEVCVAVPPPNWPDPGTIWRCQPYGGKFDVLVSDEMGDIYVADFKTGNVVDKRSGKPYPDMFIQMAAYKVAAEETYPGLRIKGFIGFHVRHDVPPEKVKIPCQKPDLAEKAWLKVRGLYDDLKDLENE